MKKLALPLLAPVLTLFAAGHGALAADAARHPCAAEADPAARLACYDRAFGTPAPAPPPAAKPPAPAPAAKPEDFGYTDKQRARDAAGNAPSEEITSITASVNKIERLRNGYFAVHLDNGQVWTQTELKSNALIAVGDSISIRRGAFGSYLLTTKAGIGTKVRRVR
jgi:hypothetical protein